MTVRLWIGVLVSSFLFLSCLCPISTTAGKQNQPAPTCEGGIFDVVNGRLYRITRIEGQESEEHWITLRITRNCDILYPEDLSKLDIRSVTIKNPRSSRGPVLMVRIRTIDPQGRPIICTSPLLEHEPMHVICPPEAGMVSYTLEPMD
jgi:hypothetical protein